MHEPTRLFWIFLTTGALVGGAAIAIPHEFAASQPISAAQMNTNFAALQDELTDLRQDLDAARLAVARAQAGYIYCGKTPPMTGLVDDDNGYLALRNQCKVACNDSNTARLCTGNDLMNTRSRGETVPDNLRFGTYGFSHEPPTATSSEAAINDCSGFRSNGSGVAFRLESLATVPNGNYAYQRSCADSLPYACCDFVP